MKKKLLVAIVAVIAVAVVLLFFFVPHEKRVYFVSAEGILHYPADRGELVFEKTLLSENASQKLYKVVFESRGEKVYGLLRMPKTSGTHAAAIVLAGAQVKKEGEDESRGTELAKLGLATLTIDQRGEGESKAVVKDLRAQFQDFLEGKEPDNHLMVYDVLRSFDLLSQVKEVDPQKIILFGESMGARNAIVAAGVEKRIAGVIAISTSGFNFPEQNDENAMRFLKSIDPDTYVPLISPRPLLMLHSSKDSLVPLQAAWNTFNKAREPKRFTQIDECGHGYCEQMLPAISEWLKQYGFA